MSPNDLIKCSATPYTSSNPNEEKNMKLKPLTLIISSLTLSSLAVSSTVFAENPVEAALKVEGAQVTLTVKDAPKAFTPEFVNAARENFNNFHRPHVTFDGNTPYESLNLLLKKSAVLSERV